MGEESIWENLRSHPRIDWSFVTKVRLAESDERWQMTNIKNISEGGCYFYSSRAFEVGKAVELEIKIPSVDNPIYFMGKIKRCEERKKGTTQVYGTAVQFEMMDESKKDKFIEAITFFLKMKKKS